MKRLVEYSTAELLDELDRRAVRVEVREGLEKVVLRLVADSFDVTVGQLRGPGRPERIAWPRQVAMALLVWCGMRRVDAARAVNRTNHATAIHAVRRVTDRSLQSPGFARRLAGIQAAVVREMEKGN